MARGDGWVFEYLNAQRELALQAFGDTIGGPPAIGGIRVVDGRFLYVGDLSSSVHAVKPKRTS